MVLTLDQPYTGHVSPESNPQVRPIPGGRIIKMSVAAGDNNVYLIECSTTGQALLIDAANEPERVIALVKQETPDLRLVVTTHQHIDHWWALKDVVAATGSLLSVAERAEDGVTVDADDADMRRALPAVAGRAFVGLVTASSAW